MLKDFFVFAFHIWDYINVSAAMLTSKPAVLPPKKWYLVLSRSVIWAFCIVCSADLLKGSAVLLYPRHIGMLKIYCLLSRPLMCAYCYASSADLQEGICSIVLSTANLFADGCLYFFFFFFFYFSICR